ncbi:hypothetical protein N0V88_006554 [Collariella sp. IMI 366227]|nr:hypothetical protein N0V88_006554 [Collariella sp. IMI 366227]
MSIYDSTYGYEHYDDVSGKNGGHRKGGGGKKSKGKGKGKERKAGDVDLFGALVVYGLFVGEA